MDSHLSPVCHTYEKNVSHLLRVINWSLLHWGVSWLDL